MSRLATRSTAPKRIEDMEVLKKEKEMPQKLADEILMSVLRDDNEQMAFSFKFAYWLRVTCPPFFHLMMAERAKKTFEKRALPHQRY